MRLGQVLAVGSLALVQVGHRVEPQPVDPHPQPEIHDREDRLTNRRIVVIQVRLVRVESMPEIRLRDRVPRPVRRLEILKDHPCLLVRFRMLAPHVEIAFPASGAACLAR